MNKTSTLFQDKASLSTLHMDKIYAQSNGYLFQKY